MKSPINWIIYTNSVKEIQLLRNLSFTESLLIGIKKLLIIGPSLLLITFLIWLVSVK